jgi:hypothetical protein
MQTQWAAWLAVEKAAGRGGIVHPKSIVRGLAWSETFYFNVDFSGDDFKAAFRLSPDGPGTAIEPAIVVGAHGAVVPGRTAVTCSLTVEQVDTLAEDADADGLAEMVFDMLHTPVLTGVQVRRLAFVFPISGKVADGD